MKKRTSSAMIKTVMDHRKELVILPEVFEILNKLLEWNKDNATGKVQ